MKNKRKWCIFYEVPADTAAQMRFPYFLGVFGTEYKRN